MFVQMAEGVKALYNSAIFAPIMNTIANALGTSKGVVTTYAAQGFAKFGATTCAVAIIVAILLIAGAYYLWKKKEKFGKGGFIGITIAVLVVAFLGTLGWTGWKGADSVMGLTRPGNADQYSVENTPALENSPIEGKTIMWLGSSVMQGFGAKGESMADFISKRNGTNMIKDCVAGTYIATTSEKDYQPRLILHDTTTDPVVDLVVIQLSTNDCKGLTEVGEVTPDDVRNLDAFDITTTMGAMEYMMAYCQETWGCPLLIYTSLEFDPENSVTGLQDPAIYEEMIDKCLQACDKWGSYVCNLWDLTDEMMEGVDEELYDEYMTDSVHPSRRGYLQWWDPYIENMIYDILAPGAEKPADNNVVTPVA